MILVDPRHERSGAPQQPAPRLTSLTGKTVALLDISKPGGDMFLDRLALLLVETYGVAKIIRTMKPTFAKPAPSTVLLALQGVDAVIEALAD